MVRKQQKKKWEQRTYWQHVVLAISYTSQLAILRSATVSLVDAG